MSLYGWIVFGLIVLFLFALDLGLFRKGEASEVTLRQALLATLVRVGLALVFNLGIYLGWIGTYATPQLQHQAGIEFLTGYLVEMTLSMDNVFVFALLFTYFSVSPAHQYRVLIWGVFGAIVMRAALIFVGIALINKFAWVIYIFAIILIYAGIKMIGGNEEPVSPNSNPILKLICKFLPVSNQYEGNHFLVRKNGILHATPLLVVLIVIETTDLVFAIDSIPAVIAVTRDSFIVFTSNIFAILGLRALYFALAGSLRLFHYLHYGLSSILIFIGIKMLLSHTAFAMKTEQSLFIVGGLLIASIAASLLFPKKDEAGK